MSDKHWWYATTSVCLVCLLLIVLQWLRAVDTYQPSQPQLTDNQSVSELLANADYPGAAESPQIRVPTGVFIQSLNFMSASDVNITGYVWQRYHLDTHAALLSRYNSFQEVAGFTLPEQVVSNNTITREAYRHRQGRELVIGWYIDVTVRQPFDYGHYPLDKHDIWLRLWHQEFDGNVVLTPDLDAYDSTALGVAFGLDHELVPGGWHIEDTFYYYRTENYDTNFGIDRYIGQKGFPELHFNIVVSRKFVNAFIINLVPLMVVIALLFSVIMIVTSSEKRAGVFGFSTSGSIGTTSALFFVVMLAHIQLRQQFAGAGIVYLEWFYLITYIAILLVSLDIYIFTAGSNSGWLRLVFYRDNLVVKLAFLPGILIALTLVTLAFF
ncbi:MAG: hypothetical protein Tsb0020_38240 [Haliangiales bacterium]